MIHTYGEQGTAYPVEPGQVWRVGSHLFACSDLMEHSTLRDLLGHMDCPAPAVVYTDPPWGQGMANGFRTKAGLGRASYDWTDIYREAADLAEMYGIPLWCESSRADTRIGMAVPGVITRREGPTFRGYWPIGYFGGNPSGLYYAHSEPHPPFSLTPENSEGWAVPAAVLELYRRNDGASAPAIVLDPCSGLGGVPLEAEKHGMGSISNELHPNRVSKALSRMSKLTGEEPVLLDLAKAEL